MSDIFLQIVNMSITASWIVLAVLLLRLLLKKAPKWITVLLWGIVAVRLICPFTIESVMSLIPSAETISPQVLIENPEINTGFPILNNTINPIIQESTVTVAPEKSINSLQLFVLIFSKVWVIGIAAMLIYTVISYFRVKNQVKEAVLIGDNIWGCDRVLTPFILGVIKPKIYLPFLMNEDDREYVISHEKAHLKRCDHIWKPLGFLLLSVYWFNPVMWAAYILLCRDIELACDERVIKEMGNEIKKPYSEALINSSVPRKMIAACPLAFGEVGVKERVKSVLNYKKPAFWVIVAAIITLIVTAVCLLTNPAGVKLSKIENSNIKAENFQRIYYGDSISIEGSYSDFSQKDLKSFLNLRISKTPVSLKRGSDRDKSYVLIIQDDMQYSLSSAYPLGLCFYFNEDFSEVFVNDGVKPTLSYRVKSPDKARRLYNRLCNRNGINSELKAFLDGEIARQNESDNTKGNFVAIDYEIMKLKETDSEVTLYMWVLYEEYSLKNGGLNVEAGSHIPTVITAAKNGRIYDLKEYWQPRDGSLYAKDIRRKFPFYLWHKATDSQWCIDEQTQRCEEKALKYFQQNGNISKHVDNIVDQSKNGPNIIFETALEEIYRDTEYVYYFSVIKSKYVVVTYTDGTTANVKDALNAGDITLTDLDRFGIEYTKKRLNGVIYFYEYLVEENKAPETVYITYFSEYDILSFVNELKALKWISDAMVDRLPYQFDGMLFYEREIYFNLQEKYAFCDGNFANLSDDAVRILTGYRLNAVSNSEKYSAYFDKTSFDIEGDGQKETLELGYGPTSGLFSFTFSVYKNGEKLYHNIFLSNPYDISFLKKDGKIMLKCVPLNESTDAIYYDVSIKDGNIVLSNENEKLSYFGN